MQLLMTIQREEKESKICGGAFWIPDGCPPNISLAMGGSFPNLTMA
jgi:hypothetical protein